MKERHVSMRLHEPATRILQDPRHATLAPRTDWWRGKRRARSVCASSYPPRLSAPPECVPQHRALNTDEFVVAEGYRSNVSRAGVTAYVTGTPDFDVRRLARRRVAHCRRGRCAAAAVRHERRRPCSTFRCTTVARARARVREQRVLSAELVFAGHGGAGMKHAPRKAGCSGIRTR